MNTSYLQIGGKAPGTDAIRAELLHLDVASIAQATFPLIMKIAMSGREPLRYKGGLLAAVYKGKGARSDCSNSRSILLASSISKRYHACLRDGVLPFVEQCLGPAKAGAVKGLGTDHVALYVRTMQSWAKSRGKSAALVFLDVKAAFYSVYRPLLLGNDLSDEYLAHAMKFLIIPPIYSQWLAELVEEGPVVAKAGVPPFFCRQRCDVLTHAWFGVQGSHELAYSWCGTRPGDPLGDVLFVRMCSVVLEDVREQYTGLDLHVNVPEVKLGGNVVEACQVPLPTWVDDVVTYQEAQCPREFIRRTQIACAVVHNAFGKRGLVLNTSRGKSECMLMLRGQGAQEARAWVEDNWHVGLKYTALDGVHHMSFTHVYKHMGGIVDASQSILGEIAARSGPAFAEAAALRRPIFAVGSVSLSKRAWLFRSLVLSKATYNVGTWHGLMRQEEKAWCRQVIRMYRVLIDHGDAREAAAWPHHVIAGKVCLPHPLALIAVARIKMHQAPCQVSPRPRGLSPFHAGTGFIGQRMAAGCRQRFRVGAPISKVPCH